MLKHIFFLILILLLSSSVAQAQPLQNDEQLVTIGIGLAVVPNPNYDQKPPSLTFAYQRGIADRIGFGYISVGAVASFASSLHRYYNNEIEYHKNYNYTTFGAKGSYHFDMVQLTDNVMWNDIDLYAGAIFGFTYEAAINDENDGKDKKYYLATDVFVGGRYNFYENIGIFAEAGYGLAYIKGGVSIKF